jgi:flagellar hook-associated protein 1 FlgK
VGDDMSLMGSLYVGQSGLQTGQNALNTTAHNMSNVDTVGYTRQQVQQTARTYRTLSKTNSANAYQQAGLGVQYARVKQVRDYFLDKTYRRESGRSAFYDTTYDAVGEIENLFQELEGEAFADAIKNLWESVQEIAKDPSNTVNQGVFIQRCNEFTTRAAAVYDGLCEYQDNMNYTVQQKVNQMNKYGARIAELNQQILRIEAAQVEKANDLRDERNQLTDELSKLAHINLKEDIDGNFIISVEGTEFVKEDGINEIALLQDENTGFYTPYWKHFAKTDAAGNLDISRAKVFNLDMEISTDMNTDIGGLKATLIARGDHRATYKDLENKDVYDKSIAPSVVMNIQAEFDQLINKVSTRINEVIKNAADDAQNKVPGTQYLRDPNSNPPYSEVLKIFVTKSGNEMTVSNLMVGDTIKQSPSLLGFIKDDKKVDQETADELKNIFTQADYTLNPNVKTKTTFRDYYNNLISQVSNTGNVLKGISENQQQTVDSTLAAREQIVGVSADEEMSNMIMFQNAFNASSRYINVVSEMLEHILTTLGR